MTSSVAVHDRAALDAPVFAPLRPGDAFALVSEQSGWYQVRLPDGRVGFVSKAWTLPVEGERPRFSIHATDVGTGLAVFVEGPDFTLLYDAGSNDDSRTGVNNRVLAYLAKLRPDIERIDHVVLSHAHKDHLRLLPDIFARYQVGQFSDSGRLYDTCGYRDLLVRAAAEPGMRYRTGLGGPGLQRFRFQKCGTSPNEVSISRDEAIPATPIPLGQGAAMTFIHVDSSPHHSPNENSLVVRLDLGGRRILLTGDAEAGRRADPGEAPAPGSLESELLVCCRPALAADILFVAHHGSKTSSRRAFLDAVGAQSFIVSSGPYRYSGTALPDAEVMTELGRRGAVWTTTANDTVCGTVRDKIGRDADGKAGGCDNIRIDIDAAGGVRTRYLRVAD